MGCAGVILGAGYGTRLARDIEADPAQEFKHLLGTPKPLLPIVDRPLIDLWVDAFHKAGIQKIFVVTNAAFEAVFAEWAAARGFPADMIISDGSTCNEDRLGACADIDFLIKQKKQALEGHDLVVVAGDTLFYEDFDLAAFLQAIPPSVNGVSYYELSDPAEVQKRGILEVDGSGKVTKFLEKPSPEETASRKACPAFYIYRAASVPLIGDFITAMADRPLAERDAPGRLIRWMIDGRAEVHAGRISGRFDIGGLESYKVTLQHFKNKQ